MPKHGRVPVKKQYRTRTKYDNSNVRRWVPIGWHSLNWLNNEWEINCAGYPDHYVSTLDPGNGTRFCYECQQQIPLADLYWKNRKPVPYPFLVCPRDTVEKNKSS
jgi:hypothetical protein